MQVEVEAEVNEYYRHGNTVGASKRKRTWRTRWGERREQSYVQPQIRLPPAFKRFIGRKYSVYVGKAKITVDRPNVSPCPIRFEDEGDAVILILTKDGEPH